MLIQVAVEIADPDVVAVGDLAVLVDTRQAKGQPRIALDLVGVDLIHVEGRIGHHIIGLADQFVRVFVVGDRLLDVAFQAVHCQVHLGQTYGGGVFLQPAKGEPVGGALAMLLDMRALCTNMPPEPQAGSSTVPRSGSSTWAIRETRETG